MGSSGAGCQPQELCTAVSSCAQLCPWQPAVGCAAHHADNYNSTVYIPSAHGHRKEGWRTLRNRALHPFPVPPPTCTPPCELGGCDKTPQPRIVCQSWSQPAASPFCHPWNPALGSPGTLSPVCTICNLLLLLSTGQLLGPPACLGT